MYRPIMDLSTRRRGRRRIEGGDRIPFLVLLLLLWVGNHSSAYTFLSTHPTIGTSTLRSRVFILQSLQADADADDKGHDQDYFRSEKGNVGSDEDEVDDLNERLLEDARQMFQPLFGGFENEKTLDSWQLRAGAHIMSGDNVLVCAPTGSGKTVVGEMALWWACRRLKRRAIYTTPLKALSNQKYAEFSASDLYEDTEVGLCTGDITLKRETAKVTVMTTEVYRNLAWRHDNNNGNDMNYEDNEEGGRLSDTAVVVLDEFHYMGRPDRGTVWEECVVVGPPSVQIVGLSATLANANDLAEWMEEATGRRTRLVEAPPRRPVPLRYLYATSDRLTPLLRDPLAGPGSTNGMLGCNNISNTNDENINGRSIDSSPFTKKTKEKKKKRKGKNKNDNDEIVLSMKGTSMPSGLQLHPHLIRWQAQVSERIDRAVQRNVATSVVEEYRRSRGRGDGERGNRPRYNYENNDYDNRNNRRSRREEERERRFQTRREMKKAVPSLPKLLTRLERADLCPAIFFIFSRVGCDAAAEAVVRDRLGTTNKARHFHQKKEECRRQRQRHYRSDRWEDREGRVYRSENDRFLHSEDEDIGFEYEEIEREEEDEETKIRRLQADSPDVASVLRAFDAEHSSTPECGLSSKLRTQLLLGVGVHHAGMMSTHKALVEHLFRNNLLRVVFATETLAAGMNLPARTVVMTALSKRSGPSRSSNTPLSTADLWQMAGRAGRRGMDVEGTCVLVHNVMHGGGGDNDGDVSSGPKEARRMLLSPLEPIQSQLSPSYQLVVHLLSRSGGRLDLARRIMNRSFAEWQRRKSLKTMENRNGKDDNDDGSDEAAQLKVMQCIYDDMSKEFKRLKEASASSRKSDNLESLMSMLSRCLSVFDDVSSLKRESKSLLAKIRGLELEIETLGYLRQQMLFPENDDNDEIISNQEERILQQQLEVDGHVFQDFASWANQRLLLPMPDNNNNNNDVTAFHDLLERARGIRTDRQTIKFESEDCPYVTAIELTNYAKSMVVRRNRSGSKKKKMMTTTSPLTSQLGEVSKDIQVDNVSTHNTYGDLTKLMKVLEAYGCLKQNETDVENTVEHDDHHPSFAITKPGTDVASLGFDNSLWGLLAMGGSWDVQHLSRRLDDSRQAMARAWESQDDDENKVDSDSLFDELELLLKQDGDDEYDFSRRNPRPSTPSPLPLTPKEEADELVKLLLDLDVAELAGYVSCVVAEESSSLARRASRDSGGAARAYASALYRISPSQRAVLSMATSVAERLAEVENRCGVYSSVQNLDVMACAAVTAWATGTSTWAEVLEISGLSSSSNHPGDLVRVLQRTVDALRQYAGLDPHRIVRPHIPNGLHPELRKRCRDAAVAMDRFPVSQDLVLNLDTSSSSLEDDEELDYEDDEELDYENDEELDYEDDEEVDNIESFLEENVQVIDGMLNKGDSK